MKEFIAKHREEIAGVLSGFDRLIFRGTLQSISYPEVMVEVQHQIRDVESFGFWELKDRMLPRSSRLALCADYSRSCPPSLIVLPHSPVGVCLYPRCAYRKLRPI